MRYFTGEDADNLDMLIAIADPEKIKQYKQLQAEQRIDKLVDRLYKNAFDYNDVCALLKVFTVNHIEDLQLLSDRVEKMKNNNLSQTIFNKVLTYQQVQDACKEVQEDFKRYAGLTTVEYTPEMVGKNKWYEFWK